MSTGAEQPSANTASLQPVWILLLRDTNFFYRRTDPVVGKAGDILRITDGARFSTEFAGREDELLILDDQTAAELLAIRDKEIEEKRQAILAARQQTEAEADAEAERQRHRKGLEALVIAAASESA